MNGPRGSTGDEPAPASPAAVLRSPVTGPIGDRERFAMAEGVSYRLPPPMKVAAIDIGTNSVHLIMVEVSPEGDFQVLGRDKDMVRLGRGGFDSHLLTSESMDAAIAALQRFLKMVRLKGIDKIKAVATSAVREARNGGDFMRRVRDELDLVAKVISSEEEGRLIYLGARHAMNFGDADHLVVDIGGGSVEVIVGDAYDHKVIHSAKLGGARLAEVFLKNDPPTQSQLMSLRRRIQKELDPIISSVKRFPVVRCIGTSGSLRSIAQLIKTHGSRNTNRKSQPLAFSRADLKTVISLLLGKTRDERRAIPAMDLRRVDNLLPVAVTLQTLLKPLDVKEIIPCDFALREGMITDYIGTHRRKLLARATWPNPRERSVIQLAQRCRYRKNHANHVARLALRLFDALKPLHKLDESYRELLYYAAILHDIGYMISQRDHHLHSEYLIRNGELKGFNQDEIRLVAVIARFHRKRKPNKGDRCLKNLRSRHRKPARRLIAMLRIANALDRTHFAVVSDIWCTISKDRVILHVQSAADSELEIWTTRRHAGFFEREFKRRLQIKPLEDNIEQQAENA